MAILTLDQVSKKFGSHTILDDLSMTVPQGSVFGFIGRNGAGKTTTMKLILGLMSADQGQIFVKDERVSYGQTQTNRYIGYLPDVPAFYPFMNGEEYLRFLGQIAGMSVSDSKKRSQELLDLVGLAQDKQRIKGYSRGMKQRLGIAQALMGRPQLLICDEPTSALDPLGRRDILAILSNIRQETTVLFSTHILSDVEKVCSHVALLNQGQIALAGPLENLTHQVGGPSYQVELEQAEDRLSFQAAFPKSQLDQTGKLRFSSQDYPLKAVLAWLADQDLTLRQVERVETSLDDLFQEVVR
ncbi:MULTISPECIES: ABC transporter ATP-binding protein [Aerococcus]|uniref:ABC transporter ATP-binding protein n=3 Tax=Lactobacillales TaxID=186826 RepID=A0A2I1L6K9_9LACT|nr:MULTISPECIES: ABC transporter ATP-binding protein [Aerococcus]KAA9219510.1 ABC transporter ATP-binding protein [Aerococcus loyolae]KAA9266528.1 ABC transporter ATP-binding protein [Aerococcus loyolae]MCY3025912.1 ABC transporter ATP-binding protein [Aerococcus loyolae]MCY3028211.1 ABC transporter ATP-binding protein [Aerococcus loyolae]MCY3029948.1 ABC transporter ATP-binding protein [Aerococcus loyolae]